MADILFSMFLQFLNLQMAISQLFHQQVFQAEDVPNGTPSSVIKDSKYY
jgi:hypothetical protein